MVKRFKIHLKEAHDATGLSAYAVAKHTGLSQTTVAKYTSEDGVIVDYVPMTIVTLAEFYGVNWRDKKIVETFTEDEPVEPEKEKTPLQAA